jgi:hypothetical protein
VDARVLFLAQDYLWAEITLMGKCFSLETDENLHETCNNLRRKWKWKSFLDARSSRKIVTLSPLLAGEFAIATEQSQNFQPRDRP